MKKLTVKLFAFFREGRFLKQDRSYPDEATVLDIVKDLQIDPGEIGVTMINSRHCELEKVPQAGDNVAIFPVIGGG